MQRKLLIFVLITYIIICGSMVKVSADTQNFIDDQANVLSNDTKMNINVALNEFTKATLNGKQANPQYAILIINSLDGASIENFSMKYFNSKGIGDKKNNLGILLVIAINEHKYRTQLGKGWENNTFLNEETIKEKVYQSSVTDDLRKSDYDRAVTFIISHTLNLAEKTLSWNRNTELVNTSNVYNSSKSNSPSIREVGPVLSIFLITIFSLSGFVYLSITILQKVTAFRPQYSIVQVFDFITENESSLPLLKTIEDKVGRDDIARAYRYDENASLTLEYMIPYLTRISINLNCLEGVRNTVLEKNSLELVTQHILKLQNNNHMIYSDSSYLIRDLTMFFSQSSSQILAPVYTNKFYSNDFKGTQKYSGDSYHSYSNNNNGYNGSSDFSGGGGSSDGGGASGSW